MSRTKTVCPDCVGLLLHRLPVSRNLRAFAAGALGFVAALLDERSEKCDECGLLRPWCFRYSWPDDDDACVHCGVQQGDHGNAGHSFRAQSGAVCPPHEWQATSPEAARCRRCSAVQFNIDSSKGYPPYV